MMATAFEKGDQQHTGIWIGFWIPPAEAVALAGEDGDPDWEKAEDLHMSLLFLGDSSQYTPEQIRAIRRSVAGFANTAPPLDGILSGWGVFGSSPGSGGKNVLVNLFDSPDLLDWRDGLIAAVEAVGGQVSRAHGFTPHITRAYLPPAYGIPNMGPVEPMPLTFDTLYVRVADTPSAYRLLGQAQAPAPDESLARLLRLQARREPPAGWLEEHNPNGPSGGGKVAKGGAQMFAALYGPGPVADLSGRTGTFLITKADADKRWVFGWANVSIETDKGETALLLDHHEDMILPEDLEAAAYQFVLEFRTTGEMHRGTTKGRLIESAMFTEEKMAAMGIPKGILPVGWWIGFQIDDEATWAKVKAGDYAMFSIQGRAKREVKA